MAMAQMTGKAESGRRGSQTQDAAVAQPSSQIIQEAVSELGRSLGIVEAMAASLGSVLDRLADLSLVESTAKQETTEDATAALDETATLARAGVQRARLAASALSGPSEAPAYSDRAWRSLTDAERDVATLAAEGRTNDQVAEQLFISPNTVKAHLAKVYAKLGIASRRGLTPGP